jgi:hypothetical protein
VLQGGQAAREEVSVTKRSSTPSQPPAQTKEQQVQAQIERSLRPWVGRVPPKMLARMRANLEEALTTHPVATALLSSLREREVSAAEGTGPRRSDGTAAADDDDKGASGSGAS